MSTINTIIALIGFACWFWAGVGLGINIQKRKMLKLREKQIKKSF